MKNDKEPLPSKEAGQAQQPATYHGLVDNSSVYRPEKFGPKNPPLRVVVNRLLGRLVS